MTFASLEDLVESFSTDRQVTRALNKQLEAPDAAKNATRRGTFLDAFIAQLDAQTGRALTPERAQVLRTLATALR